MNYPIAMRLMLINEQVRTAVASAPKTARPDL